MPKLHYVPKREMECLMVTDPDFFLTLQAVLCIQMCTAEHETVERKSVAVAVRVTVLLSNICTLH